MKLKSVHYPSGTVVRWKAQIPRPYKKLTFIVGLFFLTNLFTHWWSRSLPSQPEVEVLKTATEGNELFLIEKALPYLQDPSAFVANLREIALQLEVPTSWLMSVIYSESRFDANVYNHKGSGAVGLIQFMPATAKELGISSAELAVMSPSAQLRYVRDYFLKVKERYGAYEDLTDLYLAVLYPKARKQDYCFTLYANPSRAYKQNRGLDENKDGVVSISDIDKRMKRLFPEAYLDMFTDKGSKRI